MTTDAEMRENYRAIAAECRSIPGDYGLRTHTVELIVESWTGDEVGEGTKTQTVTVLQENGQPPKVKHDQHRVALGIADIGELTVGPITPVASVPWATLTQSGVAYGATAKVRITNTETNEEIYCRITEVEDEKALHVTMYVVPITE